ncbi:hypothetical protein ACRPFF_11200, partial [Neisseria sp. SLRRB23]
MVHLPDVRLHALHFRCQPIENETAYPTQLEQDYLDIADKTIALFGLKEAKLQQQKYPEDKT